MFSHRRPLLLNLISDSGGRVSASLGDVSLCSARSRAVQILLRFPVSARRFPVSHLKFSRFFKRIPGSLRTGNFAETFCNIGYLFGANRYDSPRIYKIPDSFPDGREFASMRPVRWGLHPPPRSPMRTGVSWSLTNSPQSAGIFAGPSARRAVLCRRLRSR